MKQTVIALLLSLFIPVAAAAQEENKYLPQEGEWAISVSAIPMLTYVGQFFNGALANPLDEFSGQAYLNNDVSTAAFGKINPIASISVKKMISDKSALRVNAGWLFTDKVNTYNVQDDAARVENPLSQQDVVDTRRDRTSGLSVMAGIEKRHGDGRIQGVYGAGVIGAFSTESRVFTYGNAITDINQSPSCANGGTVNIATTVPAAAGAYSYLRYTDMHTFTRNYYFGAVAYVGMEWFFAPKMSLGGEVNIAAVFSASGRKHFTAEGYNKLSQQVDTWTEVTGPSSLQFDFGTGNIGANLTLNLYF